MSISAARGIKHGDIGGPGRSSFLNLEQFKASDLNFYISIKVVNRVVDVKDGCAYQPLDNVDLGNFTGVYGDSFISGFIEGGEFNAIVNIKVQNKANVVNIKAE
jgi:hypothetical protein